MLTEALRLDFLAHFPLGKESYCPHFARPSARPSQLLVSRGLSDWDDLWLVRKLMNQGSELC